MGYFFAIYFYDSFGVELVFVSAINEDLHNGLLVMGFDFGCWLLAIGYWLLAIGCWLLAVSEDEM